MAEKQYFVTEEGLASLEQELEYLKTVHKRERNPAVFFLDLRRKSFF